MSRRKKWTLTAACAALLVLAVSIYLGTTGPPSPKSPPPIDLNNVHGFGSGATTHPGQIGVLENYYFDFKNKRDQLVQITGRRHTPEPDGQSRLTFPIVRIHLTAARVMELRAEEAVVNAPDNRLRRGVFRRRVVLTLYEAAPGRKPDLHAASADVRLRIFMDETRFDAELGQIDSDGKVHLVSPRVDFLGTGLNLSYNDLRGRINHLEVTHGQHLWVNRQTAAVSAEGATGAGGPGNATDTTGAAGTAATTGPGSVAATAPAIPAATAPAAPGVPDQYYRAVFDRNVKVHDRDADLEGELLTLLFCPGSSTQTEESLYHLGAPAPGAAAPAQPLSPSGRGGLAPTGGESGEGSAAKSKGEGEKEKVAEPTTRPLNPIAQSPDHPTAPSIPTPPAPPPADDYPVDRPLLAPQADDLVINWDGAFVLTPEDQKPADLAGPQDHLLAMTGRPLRINTPNDEKALAAEGDYLASTGRVRLAGSEAFPMVVSSPRMGVLRAPRLVINQQDGTGQVTGAGTLTTMAGPSEEKLKGESEKGKVDAAAAGPGEGPASGITLSAAAPPAPGLAAAPTDASSDLGLPLLPPSGNVAPAATTSTATAPSPRPTIIAWRDGVDMTFYLDAPESGDRSVTTHQTPNPKPQTPSPTTRPAPHLGRLAGLKTALARGQASVNHPDLDLAGDTLNVQLDPPPPPDSPLSGRQQAVRKVDAHGHTALHYRAVQQPELAVTSDAQSIDLRPNAQDKIVPTRFAAAGHVDGRRGGQRLRSDDLDVTFYDPRLAAGGPPNAAVPGFNPGGAGAHPGVPAVPAANPGAGTDQPELAVRTLLAAGHVLVDQDGPVMHVTAAKLMTDAPADRTDLFGDAAAPAQVQRADSTLVGPHIIAHQNAQTVAVPGPGTFDYVEWPKPTATPLSPRERVAASPPPGEGVPADPRASNPIDAPTTLHMVWAKEMTFDNLSGVGHFIGDVHADARSKRDTHHLAGQDVVLNLEPLPSPGSVNPGGAGVSPANPAPGLIPSPVPTQSGGRDNLGPPDSSRVRASSPATGAAPARRVVALRASDEALFQSESWADKSDGALATRLQLKGPLITFDNPVPNPKPQPGEKPVQKVRVIGPGSMLLEDYRTPQTSPAAAAVHPGGAGNPGAPAAGKQPVLGVAATAPTPVNFAGRGQTLFTWTGRLDMDAFDNTLHIADKVQMIHRPADTQEVTQLDCQELLANMTPTGGLDAWFAGKAPQPQLVSVNADKTVRVVSDNRTVLADHLFYSAADQVLLFHCDGDKLVQVQDPANPSAYTGERMRWDLAKNRLEIIHPGPTRSP